jgi:Oxidoreductase-like protein, N-terminal
MADLPTPPANDPRPKPPREPESWECCQNGCEPCVFDRYWDAMERYERALADWEQRQPAPLQDQGAE